MREREERTRGEGQREDREREEGREPGKGRKESANRHRTDVESTQSRQKKGQMKSIFLSDSDERRHRGVC